MTEGTRRMPAEWEPHQRTWMAFPTANPTFGEGADLQRARRAWSRVANTVARFEPVTVLVDPRDHAEARALLDTDIAQVPLDDAWLRDSGPTFVSNQAVDWRFNGWGAQSWARWEKDAQVAAKVAELTSTPLSPSALTQEGGAFQVDGHGTVLLTETVQLDPDRNPGWTRLQVETEIHAQLGTSQAIWLPRGLTADYGEFGTRGHVDIVAAFTSSGAVLVHTQPDPGHPDHAVSQEVLEILNQAQDARGRRLEVVELVAPRQSEVDGELVDHSYVNHYVANSAVIACSFDDPNDEAARAVLEQAYPGRSVVSVDARDIFAFGGGIHCITQQQPT
ncbi:agmatine deiminase family protein [Kineosporia babensis]|uniref:Agmatine deiminase family protein n=1 Tax=Kineosporia babensis TaxID=499548 RepID=A0A9X1SY77_9ACTN|nr:agmatine deiminase family protein [Kineosporia babensis]MCD5316030.1 agmatine deiminase family protein [Kineosporia babensis]